MPKGIAINIGANTTLPGFRGPIYPNGRFVYVPIPERKNTQTSVFVPKYRDLEIPWDVPKEYLNDTVHFDPEFPEYSLGNQYTYGDEHGVKAKPLSDLRIGDVVFFYATLTPVSAPRTEWIPPDWGAFIIGHFVLDRDPLVPSSEQDIPDDVRSVFANNAHLKRKNFDARVLISGAQQRSKLYTRAVPLSKPSNGARPNKIVNHLSSDSGLGPWWRRPLKFTEPNLEKVLTICEIWETQDREANLPLENGGNGLL